MLGYEKIKEPGPRVVSRISAYEQKLISLPLLPGGKRLLDRGYKNITIISWQLKSTRRSREYVVDSQNKKKVFNALYE